MITVRKKGNGSGKGASDSTGTTYYIPFVRDSQQYVNASMIINTTASDTSFGYRCDWEYQNKVHGSPEMDTTAEGHAVFFMFFDNITFGFTDFTITDSSLFRTADSSSGEPKTLKILNSATPYAGKGNSVGFTITCMTFTVCEPLTRGFRTSVWAPNQNCTSYTQCYSNWSAGSNGGTNGGTGIGNTVGTGGGGNTGGGTPPPCQGTTSSQRGQTVTPGCDPGWSVTPPADPCLTAQPAINSPNTLFQNSTVANAIASIHAQDPTIEHSISLGRDANGNITASSITPGGTHSGTVNTNWPGGFADVHNHPSNNEPSPGDLYMIMGLCKSRPGWNTKILSNRNGKTYAFVVVDTAAAKTFRDNSFAINPTYGPVFSDVQNDEFQNVFGFYQQQSYSSRDSKERALAYILDKYNSGVILLKKEGTTFKRLRTTTGPQNGTYDSNDCY